MRTQDLLPPYQSLQPVAAGTPPLGTVRLLDGTSPATVAAEVRDLVAAAPWTVPCAVLRGFTPDLLLEVVPSVLLRRTAILSVSPPGAAPSSFGVLQAVAGRPLPTAADVAEYVVARLNRSDATQALVSAMESDERTSAPALVWRTLEGLGRLKPHEWRRVLWLAEVAAGAWVNRGEDPDSSLSFWAGVLLGTGPRVIRDLVGWEWVVERALRVGGYLVEPDDVAQGGSRRDRPLLGRLAPTWHHRTVRVIDTPSGQHRILRG